MRRTLLLCGLTGLVCACSIWSLVRAGFRLETDFEPAEAIQTLTVRIDIGTDGDDLEGPVALDLGLGFPLWLAPTGGGQAENAPFGAFPQKSTAGAKVSAGSSATFTFEPAGGAGDDQLQTTSQLLLGTQISDIARIGFAGRGDKNWQLAGYEIKINGRPFAVNDKVELKAKEAQDSARFLLADLGLKIAPLEAELSDLRALADAQLAADADLARMADLEKELAPLLSQKQRLEGQVQGTYPWFQEPNFRSPWREESSVESVKVTVVTQVHAGAATGNYVYYRTGGHKYVLNGGAEPLSGDLGSQQFEIDLLAGPLTAADMRGHAVGMLARAQPHAKAPDRWHPERILVAIDGRIVYDSDESPIDRNSLEAIRLIPPAHRDEQGRIVANTPGQRETYLWESGKGAGLDLAGGGALPLPPPEDPAFPEPEPDIAGGGGGAFPPDFPPDFPPFPGEDGGPFPDPGGVWPGPGDFWPGGMAPPPPPSWIDWVVVWVLEELGILPPGFDPPPAGDPFQLETVEVTSGWKLDDTFTIRWSISGDESQIDHYEVSLVTVQPNSVLPYGPAVLSGNLPAGSREFSGVVVPAVSPIYYLAPVVVAVPADPAAPLPPPRIGPARAVFPPAWPAMMFQPSLQNVFISYQPAHPPQLHGVSFGGDPGGPTPAVWAAGEATSHNAILFDNPVPAWNVGVRPKLGENLRLLFRRNDFWGKERFIAYVGFLGGAGGGNDVEVEAQFFLTSAGGGWSGLKTVHLTVPLGDAGTPMQLIEQVIDMADAPGLLPDNELWINIEFKGGTVDPAHPPALFGVRMVPEP